MRKPEGNKYIQKPADNSTQSINGCLTCQFFYSTQADIDFGSNLIANFSNSYYSPNLGLFLYSSSESVRRKCTRLSSSSLVRMIPFSTSGSTFGPGTTPVR